MFSVNILCIYRIALYIKVALTILREFYVSNVGKRRRCDCAISEFARSLVTNRQGRESISKRVAIVIGNAAAEQRYNGNGQKILLFLSPYRYP